MRSPVSLNPRSLHPWLVRFCLWIGAVAASIIIPAMQDLGLGGFFEFLALHLLAFLAGIPLFFYTVTEWSRPRWIRRVLGLLPPLWLVTPMILGVLKYGWN